MRIPQILRSVAFTALFVAGSLAAFGNVITANQCVGGVCPGTLDIFSNTPGTLLASTSSSFTALDNTGVAKYNGTVRSAVYRSLGNTLDFYYQFTNNSSSADSVGRLTMTNFTGFTTDVGYRMDNWDGSGIFLTANQAALSADRSSNGGTVGFGFGALSSQINPGETSASLVIRTNAINYTAGSVTTQNGAVWTAAAYAPTTGVPEPGTFVLLGAGLVALAAFRRRA